MLQATTSVVGTEERRHQLRNMHMMASMDECDTAEHLGTSSAFQVRIHQLCCLAAAAQRRRQQLALAGMSMDSGAGTSSTCSSFDQMQCGQRNSVTQLLLEQLSHASSSAASTGVRSLLREAATSFF